MILFIGFLLLLKKYLHRALGCGFKEITITYYLLLQIDILGNSEK